MSIHQLKSLRSLLLLFLGMALFGSATPISKLVGQNFPIFTASFLRVLLGSLTLLPFALMSLSKISTIKKKDWILIIFISLFGMVGFTIFLIIGMKFVSGVAGSIIMSFTPALTGFAAFIFLGSPLGKKRIIALIFGISGILIINLYKKQFALDSPHVYLGMMFVLLAVGCEAVYTLIGKKVTETLAPILTSFLACVFSLPLFFILALFDFNKMHFTYINLSAWFSLLWWGIGTLGIGSACWYIGLAKSEGSTAAGFMAVMPISALLLSYFLLGEKFYLIHLLGIFLVLISIIIMSIVHMSSE